MNYKKPNLFIVGTGKAGSSSMHIILKQHPQIYMSEIKEPNFFLNYSDFNQIYQRDIRQYIRCFFNHVKDEAYIGESSVEYISAEHSAEIIRAFNPDAKIIIILRNPINRIISSYKMMIRNKYTKPGESFEELTQRKKAIIPRGLYYQDVKRYIDIFGRDNVKIIIFENMICDMDAAYKDICGFLGIERYDFDFSQKYNSQGKIDNSFNAKLYFAYNKLAYIFKLNKILGLFFSRQRLRKFDSKRYQRLLEKHLVPGEVEISIDQNTVDELKEYYREDIVQLEALLDVDLTMWK